MNELRIILAAHTAEDRKTIAGLLQDPCVRIICAIRPDDDGLRRMRTQPADVLLIGTTGEPEDELDFAEQIYPERNDLTILLIAPNMDAQRIARAMENGVEGVIDINGDAGTICRQMLTVVNRDHNRRGSTQKMATYDSRVIACYSPKGGAGKTTLSVNLACSLAALNKKVALVDLDLQFGNVGVFLDLPDGDTLAELAGERVIELPTVKSYLIRHQSGVMVLLSSRSPEYAELIHPEHIEKVIASLRSDFDYVIIDTGTSLGDCTISALEKSDTILFVVNEDFGALHDARRSMGVLEALNVQDKIHVIVNKDGISAIRVKDIRGLLNMVPKLVVPYDIQAAMMAVNRGVPMLHCAPNSKAARAISEYARSLAKIA